MAGSDDFGLDDDDDTEFFAAATQFEASQHDSFRASPRPTKRQRVEVRGGNSDSEAEEDAEYYFPGELGEQDESETRNSRYKIHVPRNGGQFADQIFTQTQHGLDRSPSSFRGAIWKRPPKVPPPPMFNGHTATKLVNGKVAAVVASGPKQATLNGFRIQSREGTHNGTSESDAQLAARLQAEEDAQGHNGNHITHVGPSFSGQVPIALPQELADLPSDAFASSPPAHAADSEVVLISSQIIGTQTMSRALRGPQLGLKQMTIFGQPATQDLTATQAASKRHAWPLKARDEAPTHHKLDDKAMGTWVYPTNLGTIRDYQYNIVARSLFHNTLVALPTGLGKTFIAATVMLNYYRWTKDAQIIFMAPTKPLIAQQMEACYGIVGIPRSATVLMTGETTPAIRAEEWQKRRLFFMTPQTVINDLKTGISDPKKMVLVVVDEAHKATGGYAYTEVIKFYRRFNKSFRVLALTATPGGTVEGVQAVIDALGIARVELRTEISLDIRQYIFEKRTETQVFDISEEQDLIMKHFAKALQPVLDKLAAQNAYWSRDVMQLTAFGLTQARKKWAVSDVARKATQPIKWMVHALFAVLSSLAHNISLLKYHGINPFYSGVREFQKNVESAKTKSKYGIQIAQNEEFVKMTTTLRGWTNNPDFIGHPKLEYLREVVLNHFLDAGDGHQGADVPPSATRVMIFASYRDSTDDICRVLKRSEPMIRPHVFVGQAASKGQEGMDQKRQNAVIQDFKAGQFNTLIATSIGEEGLDIGTVDLIVCYDASASPIRMLQRMGRTGRKRLGKVVSLLMKGKEESDWQKAQDNYVYIQKSIADTSKYEYRDDESPRILPKEAQPVVDKRVIDIPVENSQPIDLNERARRGKGKSKLKKPPRKFHMPDGVRTGFIKASRLDSDDEGEDSDALGKGRPQSRSTSGAAKFRLPATQLSAEPDPVQLPLLTDVFLNGVEQRELERKYARTENDSGDLVIRAPDPSRYPASLRSPGRTKYVTHGRSSESIGNAMQALQQIDDAKVQRMKDIVDMNDLLSAGDASYRLVSPHREESASEGELPELPNIPLKARKAANKPSTVTRPAKSAARRQPLANAALNEHAGAPVARKPRGRPKKSIERVVSPSAFENADAELPVPTPAAKKPRGRPRKKQAVSRTASFGSAAAEGVESSPEPTPAEMRLATQGIDLGSHDTSGEDEDEEPDSELAEFIVRSDQPIEMASSSQQLPDDAPTSASHETGSKRLTNAKTRSKPVVIDSDASSDDADQDLPALGDSADEHDSSVQESGAAIPSVPRVRKKVVVDDDDSDD